MISTTAPDPSSPNTQNELVSAFYDLTSGQPFFLDLAVTYFNGLSSQERGLHYSEQPGYLFKDYAANVAEQLVTCYDHLGDAPKRADYQASAL